MRLDGLADRYPNEMSGGQQQRGGAGARPDLAARPAAARRAARQSRPRAALRDGGGDPPLPEGAADPLHLRDPQPGGSADDERPHRGHAQRRLRADRRQRTEIYTNPATAFVAGFVGHANRFEGGCSNSPAAWRAMDWKGTTHCWCRSRATAASAAPCSTPSNTRTWRSRAASAACDPASRNSAGGHAARRHLQRARPPTTSSCSRRFRDHRQRRATALDLQPSEAVSRALAGRPPGRASGLIR